LPGGESVITPANNTPVRVVNKRSSHYGRQGYYVDYNWIDEMYTKDFGGHYHPIWHVDFVDTGILEHCWFYPEDVEEVK
jgi:hypothetical protein